jgi:pimeloyl-ACP methyl ester carboxylesterase
MSLGGLTTIHLAATRPDLVRRALLVDVTPGSPRTAARMTDRQRCTVALTRGPRSYASLEEMVAAAVRASPRRPASAVRRGVVHNSRRLPDGTWTWRYDQNDASPAALEAPILWADLSALTMPTMLVTDGDSAFVTADDLTELTRRLSAIRVEQIPAAGHAVQSDQPRALAALIQEFVSG